MTMSLGVRYQPAGPQIIHELIDGEVVLINLDSGAYYSVDGAGATVWSGIAADLSEEALITYVDARYHGDSATIAQDVRRFLNELLAEGLIAHTATSGSAAPIAPTESVETVQRYAPPTLSKYTDMEELITLDPIHEVDERGWPARRATDATEAQ